MTSPVTSAVLAIRIDGQLSTAAQSQSRNGDILLLFFFSNAELRLPILQPFAGVRSLRMERRRSGSQRQRNG